MTALPEDWSLVYEGYQPHQEGLREALCTLGNGYFSTRGAAPDCADDDVHYPGCYLAGGYNRATSEVSGREIENEDLVNLPNWLPLTIRIDGGPWFHIDEMEILAFRQDLNLREGILARTVRLRDPEGRTTRWSERRIVSMADRHVAAISLEVEPEDWSGELGIRTAIDGSVINNNVKRYRALTSRHLEILDTQAHDEDIIQLVSRTTQSRLEIAQAARTRVYRGTEPAAEESRETIREPDRISQEIAIKIASGERILIEKIVSLFTSRDMTISAPALEAIDAVREAPRFEALLAEHRLVWDHLWDDCDIDIVVDPIPDAELKLRVHIFHLLQTVSEASIDQDVGVPARGWHGEAYRGHIFWDELFIFPFLNQRRPVLTKALLLYRYRRLPAARRHAVEEGYRGALFPWQSGSNGREESQRLHLNPMSGEWVPDNTHRQRHINAAVAYNIWHYYEVTDDCEFMRDYGAEMLFEIARFWASAASFNPARGRYDIRHVMGPDEFHTAYPGIPPEAEAGIDNNAYTNVMASWCLHRAIDIFDILPPYCRDRLRARIDLSEDEVKLWGDISRKLFIPFHDDCIISQFEGYEALEEFDWDGYRERYGDIHRLDRILGAEGKSVNAYKVSKQADVLMLFYLFSAEELANLFERLDYPFRNDWIPKNINYYLARTSHGSTLSLIVHSWVLARADRPMSWEMLSTALDADLADIQGGTTHEGIHLGAMAGTVDLIQRCFTGIETRGGVLYLNPVLPEGLKCLAARIRYRQQRLDVEVTGDRLRVSSRHQIAPSVTIAYRGHYRTVAPGNSYEFHLIKRHRG